MDPKKIKVKGALICIAILALFLVLAVKVSYRKLKLIANHDVIQDLKNSNDGLLEVKFERAWCSKSHIIVFSFSVEGHEQISKAVWYAKPWRKVMTEK